MIGAIFLRGGLIAALSASGALAGNLVAEPASLTVAQTETGASAGDETSVPVSAEATGSGAGPAQDPSVAIVHVIAENVESADGTIWLALCNESLSVDGCPYKQSVPAEPGFVELTFADVPPGEYAVVGFHDVDSNEKFNRTLGVPREPYALSAAAGDMLVPTFEDAKVAIAAGENDVIIRMKRMKL